MRFALGFVCGAAAMFALVIHCVKLQMQRFMW